MDWCISSMRSGCCSLSFASTYSTVHPAVTHGSASLNLLQLCRGLEGLETHIQEMAIGLWMWVGARISDIREDTSMRAGPVGSWVGHWVVELSQAGLKGVEALGDDRGHWCGVGGGGSGGSRRGQVLALTVGMEVGKRRLRSLSRTLHPQEPRNPLQQN